MNKTQDPLADAFRAALRGRPTPAHRRAPIAAHRAAQRAHGTCPGCGRERTWCRVLGPCALRNLAGVTGALFATVVLFMTVSGLALLFR